MLRYQLGARFTFSIFAYNFQILSFDISESNETMTICSLKFLWNRFKQIALCDEN